MSRMGPAKPMRFNKGFSMLEIMVTVAIVSTCLLGVFRVFFICARAMSEAHNRALAVVLLRGKMNEIKLQAIEEDGVSQFSLSKSVPLGNKKMSYAADSSEFEETAELPEGSEEAPREEEEESEEDFKLYRVKVSARWSGGSGGAGGIEAETLIPARGLRHEF